MSTPLPTNAPQPFTTQQPSRAVLGIFVVSILAVIVAAFVLLYLVRSEESLQGSGYSVVKTMNDEVYIGKVSGTSGEFLKLEDVKRYASGASSTIDSILLNTAWIASVRSFSEGTSLLDVEKTIQ